MLEGEKGYRPYAGEKNTQEETRRISFFVVGGNVFLGGKKNITIIIKNKAELVKRTIRRILWFKVMKTFFNTRRKTETYGNRKPSNAFHCCVGSARPL